VHWHVPRRGAQTPAIAAQAARQAQADGGILVAAGGDGTLNAAASAAWPLGLPIGVLAQGTFNYFSRQHGLPEDPHEAVDALARATERQWLRPVQIGQVNGQLFLVNASLGHYPRLLSERETAHRRRGRSRLVALLAALGSLLRPLPGQRLSITRRDRFGRSDEREVRASTLFVGNNPLQFEQVGLDDDADPQARELLGCLQAVTLAPARRWAMARLLLRAATAQLGADPLIEHEPFYSLDVRSRGWRARKRVSVAFDGERTTMQLPLRFQVGDRPLWLVAPPVLAQVDDTANAAERAAQPVLRPVSPVDDLQAA
jgi:diacylglycerol kinase family enzyme